MGFFTGLAFWGKNLAKGIAWPAKSLKSDHKLGPVLRWTLHLLVVGALLAGLGFVNYALGMERLLRAPWSWLRFVWLPLLFLAFYLAGWFAWWLARLLRSGPESSQWPDIDGAWEQCKEAVARAGIDLCSVPVFLLLGRPAGDMRSLLAAAEVPLAVPQAPHSEVAPFHVYANRDAVYLACENTSLLGRHAALMAQQAVECCPDRPGADHPGPSSDEQELWNDDYAVRPAAPSQQDSVESLQSAVALLVDDAPASTGPEPAAVQLSCPTLLEQADEVQRITSRLQHLCTLLGRDRQPYCPINGMLVLIPYAATDDELAAGRTAVLLERDLTTIQNTLEVRCGVVTLVCDLQTNAGGRELLARFPESQRRRRLGVSYPLLAQCDSEHVPDMLAKGVAWTCHGLVPPITYRLAQVHGGSAADVSDQVRANTHLYELIADLRKRESRLTRLLQRAFSPEGTSPWMMTGCYLAATGEDAVRGQGFAGGIFPQLVQIQNHVTWTADALADDRACRRLAWIGYAALAVSIVGITALLVVL